MKWVYKITYPNGKIYIGKDLTGDINYWGSVDSKKIEKDFSMDELKSFTITRELLWFSETATDKEINRREVEEIRRYCSNNPKIGYNKWPKYKSNGQ